LRQTGELLAPKENGRSEERSRLPGAQSHSDREEKNPLVKKKRADCWEKKDTGRGLLGLLPRKGQAQEIRETRTTRN